VTVPAQFPKLINTTDPNYGRGWTSKRKLQFITKWKTICHSSIQTTRQRKISNLRIISDGNEFPVVLINSIYRFRLKENLSLLTSLGLPFYFDDSYLPYPFHMIQSSQDMMLERFLPTTWTSHQPFLRSFSLSKTEDQLSTTSRSFQTGYISYIMGAQVLLEIVDLVAKPKIFAVLSVLESHHDWRTWQRKQWQQDFHPACR